MKRALFLLFAITSLSVFSACSSDDTGTNVTPTIDLAQMQLLYHFVPSDADSADDYLIYRTQYTLNYNYIRNCLNWAAYELDQFDFGTVKRSERFRMDSLLPASFQRATYSDYTNSGYERGHMVKSEDRNSTLDDMYSTYVMSVICPQYHKVNTMTWAKIENYADSCALAGDTLYIVAGCIWNSDHTYINNKIEIPDTLYRIMYNISKHTTLAVKVPNISDPETATFTPYICTIEDIEKSTGYTFSRLK